MTITMQSANIYSLGIVGLRLKIVQLDSLALLILVLPFYPNM